MAFEDIYKKIEDFNTKDLEELKSRVQKLDEEINKLKAMGYIISPSTIPFPAQPPSDGLGCCCENRIAKTNDIKGVIDDITYRSMMDTINKQREIINKLTEENNTLRDKIEKRYEYNLREEALKDKLAEEYFM